LSNRNMDRWLNRQFTKDNQVLHFIREMQAKVPGISDTHTPTED
jgi:hypothetical protein